MRKNSKKNILMLTVLSFCVVLYGQSVNDDNIELPELTTEVEGFTVTAEDDSLPDFTFIMKVPSASEDILPELPVVSVQERKSNISASEQEHSSVYTEGRIGGGYPGLFIGDFSVYTKDEDSPFKIEFLHNSSNGYSNNNLLSCFSDRETSIDVEKTLSLNQFRFDFSTDYKNVGNGLQSKSNYFSGINQNDLDGEVLGIWTPVKVFSIGSSVKARYYNRYADAITKDAFLLSDWIASTSIFSISPDFFMNWEDFGFNAGFRGAYSFDLSTSNVYSDKTNNRGDFQISLGWKNDNLKLFGNVGLVFGNQINSSVVIPFTAGLDLTFPTYFSNRNFDITLSGGLDTKRTSIADNELLHKFSGFSCVPAEQSDWFGALEIILPIKTSFTAKIDAEYRVSALCNGVWDVLYTDSGFSNGIYTYAQIDRQLFKTDLNISYRYKIFSITGKWHSNWMYVPAGDYSQLVSINLGFQSKTSRWGIDLGVSLPTNGTADYSPIIDMEAFAGVTSSARIVLSAQDIYKLFTGTSRQYAGIYAGRSGNASLLVKFFF